MSDIGHNNGPAMDAGFAFRKHAWTKARAQLIPTLPIEILRNRVTRAKELGLPYKTYASVRASTGRDVVGFLFSNNALRVFRANAEIPKLRADKLAKVVAAKTGLAHAPLTLDHLNLTANGQAPHFNAAWSDIRRLVQAPLHQSKLPFDGVLVVGDTTLEREWSDAGRLAGYLTAEQFFSADLTTS
ncbi:MAG: hypothetical protein ABJ327_26595 [Litoreibacter sp.]